MPKTEVYSWRLSPATKMALESAARREGTTVSRLLDRMTLEWLKSRGASVDDDAEEALLHERARAAIGAVAGVDPYRSSRVRELVRARLKRRHAR